VLRFGLGFNAVYHLTDLPSFVSGPHLVLFDPHAAYLPGATPAAPGLRVEVTRGRLAEQFPDAFAPYQQYGCSMKVRGRGIQGWMGSMVIEVVSL
jgi:sacsin